MDALYIRGGNALNGCIDVDTAKNAILPILAGSLMSSGTITIHKCTLYSDVLFMIRILSDLGVKSEIDGDNVILYPSFADRFEINEECTKKIRSSIFMLGPLLTTFKYAKVAYPGGCNIGNRPIDLHIKGLRALNVKIEERHGYIFCDGKNMKAGAVHLDFPSVGATENLIMASVKLKGTTTIYNAAREPEIIDLQNFINSMGGRVNGAGSSTITITGVHKLNSSNYTPIFDRIITGTYLIACAMAGGDIKINGGVVDHNMGLVSKLKNVGCKIEHDNKSIRIISKSRLKSIPRIETQPYPGFATDLQNQILALQTISKGTSVVTENLFETRFKIYTELCKMGADITINGQTAIVKGVSRLYGANVVATDLRGGAGLVIAGLAADGYTTIEDVYHVDRGYKNIELNLSRLNADIRRINI